MVNNNEGLAMLRNSRLSPKALTVENFENPHVQAMILGWATASFWFPLMVAIGVWRHVINKVPLRYHPSYWAMVFPLGMYGVSTFRMRVAIELEVLEWLPRATLVLALSAWTLLAVGLVSQAAEAMGRLRSGGKPAG